jgi:ppGpp synthetase/RelA/SpoT-type nucleotidyltranferase
MDKAQAKKDYAKHKLVFKSFQREIADYLSNSKTVGSSKIDIHSITPREDIKSLESIIANIDKNKYKGKKDIFDISDIAGVRVICHTRTDKDLLKDLLKGELQKKYETPKLEDKSKVGSGEYKAFHIDVVKEVKVGNLNKRIRCEVQIRTVLQDAWSVQHHKYLYKKSVEGDSSVLSTAISSILDACEVLWDLVRRDSKTKGEDSDQPSLIERKTEPEKEEVPAVEPKQEIKNWLARHSGQAYKLLKKDEILGYMELNFFLPDFSTEISDKERLRDFADKAQVHTFGWPIGIVLNREEFKPRVDRDGIVAKVRIKGEEDRRFDYWALGKDGRYFLLKSLFEDTRKEGVIFLDTRIIRTTEVLMFARNLYEQMGVPEHSPIVVTVKYGGIKNRVLNVASPTRLWFRDRKNTEENGVSTTIATNIAEMKGDVAQLVDKLTSDLFGLFDFYKVNQGVLKEIVDNYLVGKIT